MRGNPRIARLVEIYALERGLRLYGYGSTTFREARHAAMPDQHDAVVALRDELRASSLRKQ